MKILLIRFSSFGDVVQTLSVAAKLKRAYPGAEVHWVTRAEFRPLVEEHPDVARVWTILKGSRFSDLLRLGRTLRRERFDRVYDAHNNLRSRVIGWAVGGVGGWRRWVGRPRVLRRSLYRGRRFALFRFRINLYPKPFPGQFALLEPLAAWGVDASLPPTPQLTLPDGPSPALPFSEYVALAPSAAFALKRWPLENFAELIRLQPGLNFVLLGGPEDLFVNALVDVDPTRVVSGVGTLDLVASARVVRGARALVSNDTGLMHVAEQTGRPCVALMGPAPFGYPARPTTRVLERELWCRPCSKHGQGPCVNPNFQACLRTISPREVAAALDEVLGA